MTNLNTRFNMNTAPEEAHHEEEEEEEEEEEDEDREVEDERGSRVRGRGASDLDHGCTLAEMLESQTSQGHGTGH
eukprot:COSAG05_NODE_2573_length_2884_cov_2.063555_2_plen_75_part_00